ncbi:MAG: VWA domain-containing protein [Anaerosomatales bacterium]|nr:VWA domain-containing protein [Anaerosomatales bacterium]
MAGRRTARWLAAALAAVALVLPAPGAGAQPGPEGALAITGADTGPYPDVALEVALPAEAAGRDDVRFTVTENGEAVDVVSAGTEPASEQPVRAVLVLDTSGSMAGRALQDAKAAARAFIEGMGPDDTVALVTFSDSARTVSEFTTDRAALAALVDGLRAAGETALYDALGHAARLARDADGGRPVIVLLSDGGDTVSASSLDAAVRALTNAGAPVYAVVLQTKEWDPKALRAVTRATSGRLLQTNDSAELLEIYRGLATEIANVWTVVFQSREPRTKDLDVQVRASAGPWTAAGSIVVPNPLYSGAPPADPGIRPGKPAPLLLAAAALAVFGSVAFGATALASLLTPSRTRLDRLAFYDQAAEEVRRSSPDSAGFQSRLVDAIGEVAGRRGFTRMFAERLQQAGLAIRPAEFIALHVLGVVVAGALAALATGALVVGVAVAVLAAFVPLAWLDSAIHKRREAFEEQLPDVLDLIAGSLRAGWGLQQAIGLVVEQSAPPASLEFARAQAEARLGIPVEQALEKMAERLGSEDFRWTVAAIAVQRDVGGNLAEVLDIVARTMRERAQTRRQVRALTAEGRLSAIVLIALPFVELVALLVINPGYMSLLFTTPTGWAMSAIAVVLMVVGIVWLNRVMTVEV